MAETDIVKIIIIGDAGTGKTSLIKRYVNPNNPLINTNTVSVDIEKKEIQMENKPVTVQIWDTAGQERFRSLSKLYYRCSDCCAIIFDLSKPTSRRDIEAWVDTFEEIYNPDTGGFKIFIIGNKRDVENKKKTKGWVADIIHLTEERGFEFRKVSAKTGEGVEAVFHEMARCALDKVNHENVHRREESPRISVSKEQPEATSTNNTTKKGCCS